MQKISLILMLSMLLSGCLITGHGTREGIIVKNSQEGVICPTYEAELIRGGMSNGNGGFGVKPFDFTIENPELLATVQKAADEQKEVLITYHSEWVTFCRSETSRTPFPDHNVFLDSIKILN